MSEFEKTLYIFIGDLAFIVFNIGMLIFDVNIIVDRNGCLNPIPMTGVCVHSLLVILGIVFGFFRIKELKTEHD